MVYAHRLWFNAETSVLTLHRTLITVMVVEIAAASMRFAVLVAVNVLVDIKIVIKPLMMVANAPRAAKPIQLNAQPLQLVIPPNKIRAQQMINIVITQQALQFVLLALPVS